MQNPLLHIVAWQGHSRDPGQVQPRALIRTKQAHWQEIKQPYWQVQKTSASKVHPSIVTLDAAPTQSQCCFLAYLTLAPLVTCIAPTLPQHLPLPKQWMETVWNCFHTASTQSQHSLHAARTQVQCSWNISARSPHAATEQGLGLEVRDWRNPDGLEIGENIWGLGETTGRLEKDVHHTSTRIQALKIMFLSLHKASWRLLTCHLQEVCW